MGLSGHASTQLGQGSTHKALLLTQDTSKRDAASSQVSTTSPQASLASARDEGPAGGPGAAAQSTPSGPLTPVDEATTQLKLTLKLCPVSAVGHKARSFSRWSDINVSSESQGGALGAWTLWREGKRNAAVMVEGLDTHKQGSFPTWLQHM